MGHVTSTVCVGLDLAWSDRNRTGVAVLRDGRLVQWSGTLGANDEILSWVHEAVRGAHAVVVAIDAPLRVPNEGGGRRCDHEVSSAWGRYAAGAYPANRRLLARDGHVRGEVLAAALARELGFVEVAPIPARGSGRYLCEVYPHPAHISLFGLSHILRYKRKPRREMATILAEFERYRGLLAGLTMAEPPMTGLGELLTADLSALRGKGLHAMEETLDAITCAYVGWYAWWHGPARQQVYGSVGEGHILVPVVGDKVTGDKVTGDR